MIKVKGLYKRYGTHLAVEDVSFSIEKGEVVGFLGPNGAGKSTIMNILTGYLSMTQGEVLIDDFNIMDNPEKAKARIGYLPELPPLYTDMKVIEYLYFIYDLKKVKFPKKPHIEEVMRLVGINDVSQRLIKNLSKGYRQRVGFAQALVGNPDVLILDEPTVGLDPKQIIEIRNLIEKLGKNHTVILSSHILSEIQSVCKRLIIINKGKLIADDSFEHLSAKLSKDAGINLCVKGAEENLIDGLSSVSGVQSVKLLSEEEDGIKNLHITPQTDADIKEAVFDMVVRCGGKILNMSADDVSLEQIFLKLTENSDNAEAIQILKSKGEEK